MEKIPPQYKRVCFHCGQEFDIREGYIKPQGNRYAHIECPEGAERKSDLLVSPQDGKEVACFYCGETFVLDGENYRLARVNRYAHPECYKKYHQEDDEFIDNIYQTLKQYGVDYNYLRCENQRQKYISEFGYTNKGISMTLEYFYKEKKGDPKKANGGIGIIPYIYEDAGRYYYELRSRQKQLEFLLETKPEEIEIPIAGNGKKKTRKSINLDDL